MLTTLDLESSLLARIEAAAQARGISTREFIREALRQALEDAPGTRTLQPFVQRVHDFGIHIESPWTILADMETEDHARRYGRK
jgi:hypothetical protein